MDAILTFPKINLKDIIEYFFPEEEKMKFTDFKYKAIGKTVDLYPGLSGEERMKLLQDDRDGYRYRHSHVLETPSKKKKSKKTKPETLKADNKIDSQSPLKKVLSITKTVDEYPNLSPEERFRLLQSERTECKYSPEVLEKIFENFRMYENDN